MGVKFSGFILLCLPFIAIGQGGGSNPDNFQKMTDLLPPPPNAAAIIKYGGIAINKNTGAPSITIPLYTIKGKNISVPVVLSYASTGVKVDEIASRAGMGWVLQAGGVVTRTVRGWADETHPRIIPWWTNVGVNWQTFKFMKDVSDAWFYGGVDAEPDLFSFNFPGGSGSFVLDHQMNPVQQTYSNQKILLDFSGTDWNIKIIDDAGIEYYFGGTGRLEKTKRTSNCGKNFDGYITTAWYLKKILHPSGEEILLNYTPLTYSHETGLSQTYDYTFPIVRVEGCCYCPGWENGCPGAQSHAQMKPTCVNKVMTEGVLLDNITCINTYQKASFSYTSRSDCDDKLISSVSFINTLDNATVGMFSLVYNTYGSSSAYPGVTETVSGIDQTPYLTSLIEHATSGSGVVPKTHWFQYLDPTGRCKRLSFAQDHWGYFNGKPNINLLPKPPSNDLQMMSRFPDAYADREPDGEFGSKGMLCSVVYPTGGKDSIIYEPNQSTNTNANTRLRHELNCSVTGNPYPGPIAEKTSYIYIGNSQTVELKITVGNSEPQGNLDSLHDFGKIIILNSNGAPVYEEQFTPGSTLNVIRYVNLMGNTTGITQYTVKIIAQRSTYISTHLEMKYYSFNSSQGSVTKLSGGQRVKTVLTSNEGNVPMIKRYYYGEIGSLNSSSGISTVPSHNYIKSYEVRNTCIITANPSQTTKNYCQHTALYSTSLSGLYNYQSSPVSYASVVESIGENFEGGGTQSRFKVIGDQKGQLLWGVELQDAPLTSFSNYGNGDLIEQIIYKKSGSTLLPVKKTEYTYTLDNRGFKSVWGYIVNKKYEFGPWQPTTDSACVIAGNPVCTGNIQDNMECFDMMRYEFPSYWIYNSMTKESVFDQNGQNPVISLTSKFYDDATYQQLSRTESINSKGELLRNEFKYPNDYPGTQVYQEMTTKNIISPVIETASYNIGTEVAKLKTNYIKDIASNNYVVSSMEKSIGVNPLEVIGEVLTYDAKSNICAYKGKDGVENCIVWGYNYLYPVAKISGASYASVTALLSGGVTGIQSLDGQPLRDALNAIRQGLPNAFVTTYTYKHLVGVKTITDADNRTSTFNYDGFNRLIEILDNDGNVVKKNEYNYSLTQLEKLGLYVNETQSAVFTTQHCNSGYRGSQITYYVPGGTYYSVISVADANLKAQADLQINGQAYVNRTGFCILDPANCTGEGYAIIGCGCELGQKICISSTETPPGSSSWVTYYKYRWSDGSESSNYGPVTVSCTGIEYRMIGCDCRRGLKIYYSSTYVTSGPGAPYWLCEYRYHWPDGYQSPMYTEQSATSCESSIQ